MKALDRILLDDGAFELLTEEEQAEFLSLIDKAVGPRWDLFPKQMLADALWGKVDWLLFGGAAGGAKSELACHHANRLSLEIPNHTTLLIRRSIPELRRSLILRIITRIKQFKIPARYRKVDGSSVFQYDNGSLIECGHCATDEHVAKYLSAEYGCIIIDEASQLTPDQIMKLSARLRVTHDMRAAGARPHLGLFTNPGDVAHAWLYDLFVTPSEYGNRVVVYNIADGIESMFPVRFYDAPVSVRRASPADILETLVPWAESLELDVDPRTELSVAFVPALAMDNPHIDPSYLKFLNALPERRRRQLRDGDWDTFEGQYFEAWSSNVHVVEPFEIPEGWQRVRALDFGTQAPFCCLWLAWDNDGNCYVYREAYEAGLNPAEQARKVVGMSVDRDGRRERYVASVADPSVFSDRRGYGKSIADLWRDNGLHVSKARNERVAGWSNVRQYLWDREKPLPGGGKGGPRLFVFNTCPNLIRTFPLQQHDQHDPEDLNTKLEDHAVDAVRYGLAVRWLGDVSGPKRRGFSSMDERWTHMLRSMDRRKGRWRS